MKLRPHTSDAFEHVLTQYHLKLDQMFSGCYLSIKRAGEALINSQLDQANQVIAEDEKLDDLEQQMNAEGVNILACFSPISSDLRVVLALMRLAGLLERLGDYAVGVARHTLRYNKQTPLREVVYLEPMIQVVCEHINVSRQAIHTQDFHLIHEELCMIPQMRIQSKALTEKLTELSEQTSISISALAELIQISRLLEFCVDYLKQIDQEILELE